MYITEGDLENYMLQDIDSTYSTFVADVITMVEDYINKYTGVDFENASSTERYYDGSEADELIIDDVQSVSAVTIYDTNGSQLHTLTENTDYFLYPLNETIKNRLVLTTGKIGVFPSYSRSIKVTGVFGFSTVPTAIKIAALKLAAKILEKGLKGGEASSESLGSYSIDYRELNDTADALGIFDILNMYRVRRLG